MDFTLSDEQSAIAELAGRILGEQLTPERLSEVEATEDAFDREVWSELAKADLLGLSLPEAHGGGGYGFFELGLLLEQAGQAVAPLPLLPTLVLGALPVARFGSTAQQGELLPGVIAGEVLLTAALVEPGEELPEGAPSTTARSDGDGGWVVTGTKVLVPAAHLAARILVPATTGPDASTVFLVDPAAAGVRLERNRSANGEVLATVHLEEVAVGAGAVLGGEGSGAEVVRWILERAVAATCSLQAGVCEAAVRLTAGYTSQRRQFETPIATFQAVAHRAADAYIDTEAVRLTARQAAWRLGEGLDAAEQVAVAGFWAAEGSHRVVHAAQHLHGGIGVDTDYPLHRMFRWAKHLELSLGSGNAHLRSLGGLLAAG